MKFVNIVAILLLVLDVTHGRWNLGRLLLKKNLNVIQEEKFPWHQRLLRKVKRQQRLATHDTQEPQSWKLKIQQSVKRLIPKRQPKKKVKEHTNEKRPRVSKRLENQSDTVPPKKKRRQQAANETATASHCSSLKQTRSFWKRYRDSTNADTAYRMAILSSLAYWEFHKRPTNITSFRLQTDKQYKRKSLKQSARVALCHVASGVSNSNTIVEKHHGSNRNLLEQQQSCRQVVSRRSNSGYLYDFQWYLHDWHEPTPLAGKWHDTDLLIATSGDDTLVLSFAGTASAADAVTNVQTFEKVGHSGIFNITGGSIHRGFLNAYSRVERGRVSRVCREDNCDEQFNNLTSSLHQRYQHCYLDEFANESGNSQAFNSTAKDKKAKRRKCRGRDEKLMNILRELVNRALLAGHKVHLTGHSLGGGLATLMALDVILNFPSIPISKLHLWTFGAPEVADDVFLQSAMNSSPRLKAYIQNRGRRYHRYVTLSDKCKADVVSTIASKTLPSHKQGLHGRIARTLGGVRGRLVHMAEPHYLPPLLLANGTAVNEDAPPTKTSSALGAHHITSYLQGISRESPSHPLTSNLPVDVAEFVGEFPPQKVASSIAG